MAELKVEKPAGVLDRWVLDYKMVRLQDEEPAGLLDTPDCQIDCLINGSPDCHTSWINRDAHKDQWQRNQD